MIVRATVPRQVDAELMTGRDAGEGLSDGDTMSITSSTSSDSDDALILAREAASPRLRLDRSQSSRSDRAAARSARARDARLKADLEHSLLSCLVFNVVYTYYCDMRLLVLFIRLSQVLRLLYYPYETPEARRSTSVLLWISNLPILLIHGGLLAQGESGSMLLINFIGPEPHPLAKLLYIDVVVMFLEAALASTIAADLRVVSSLPVSQEPEGSLEEDGDSDDATGGDPSSSSSREESSGDLNRTSGSEHDRDDDIEGISEDEVTERRRGMSRNREHRSSSVSRLGSRHVQNGHEDTSSNRRAPTNLRDSVGEISTDGAPLLASAGRP